MKSPKYVYLVALYYNIKTGKQEPKLMRFEPGEETGESLKLAGLPKKVLSEVTDLFAKVAPKLYAEKVGWAKVPPALKTKLAKLPNSAWNW